MNTNGHQWEKFGNAIREEVEDLFDYLEIIEARARDQGKPRLSHDEVKKRYGLK